MVARDLTAGPRKHLLAEPDRHHRADFQCRRHRHLRPAGRIARQRNAAHLRHARERPGFDLNRDAVKLETVEANGMYRLLNDWDPALLLDGHLMSRVNHGYANTYGTTTVPAAAPVRATTRTTRCFLPFAKWCGSSSASKCSPMRSSAAAAAGRRPRGAMTPRRGRSKPSSSSTTTACGTGWRSSPRRRASRRSSGASTRSTPTSPRFSSTRTRTPRKFRQSSRPPTTRRSPMCWRARSRVSSGTGSTASTARAGRSTCSATGRTSPSTGRGRAS